MEASVITLPVIGLGFGRSGMKGMRIVIVDFQPARTRRAPEAGRNLKTVWVCRVAGHSLSRRQAPVSTRESVSGGARFQIK
jgi:hypothetical protein